MRVVALILAFLMFLAVASRRSSANASRAPLGVFSRASTEIWGRTGAPMVIKSPDGRCALIAEYHYGVKGGMGRSTVYLEIGGKRFPTNIGSLVNSEVQWSPDSKALAVTFSDGGDVGTYNSEIYWIESDGFRVGDPAASVKTAYRSQRLVCFEPEPPNIGVITWLGSSQRILLAAEVPPHSNCDDFGTFKAYMVQLPGGRVLKVYGQIEAKRLFGPSLGQELANANDECFTKPGSCQIPQLHEH